MVVVSGDERHDHIGPDLSLHELTNHLHFDPLATSTIAMMPALTGLGENRQPVSPSAITCRSFLPPISPTVAPAFSESAVFPEYFMSGSTPLGGIDRPPLPIIS